LRDACDHALELVVAEGAAGEATDDEGGPLAADASEDAAGRAGGIEDAWVGRHPVNGSAETGMGQAEAPITNQTWCISYLMVYLTDGMC